jgi:hypothetical protein
MKLGTGLLLWYGIFCFVTGQINPMEWSTTAKVWAVIVGLLVVNSTKDKEY